MNIKRLVGASALLFAITATSAHANSVTVSGPATVNIGDTFDIQLIGDFGAGGFNGGGVDAVWSDPQLDLNSVTLAPLTGLDPGFSCPGAGNCPADTNDTARVAWGTFTGPMIPGNAGPTLMATLSFTAVGAGAANISLVDAGLGWLDATFTPIPIPDFNGATVSVEGAVVPVPAAVWLFGSGLIGLVGMARRRKAA